jgi:hypothetical protein
LADLTFTGEGQKGLAVNSQTDYFVVEGGVFTNSEIQYPTDASSYFKRVKLTARPGFSGPGLLPNGYVSLVGCTFEGFKQAMYIQKGYILNCLWNNRTVVGLCITHGGEADTRFEIKGYAFEAMSGMLIQMKSQVYISDTCFRQTGPVVQKHEG